MYGMFAGKRFAPWLHISECLPFSFQPKSEMAESGVAQALQE